MNQTILEEKQPKFYQTVVKSLQATKKVQHAYLIETKQVEEKEKLVLSFVEELFELKREENLISRKKLHHLIEINSFPDLKILKPTGNVIKKEELIALKESFIEKSTYGGYQIYVIYNAEKLNTSSANTILKFLEEPEENIIAVLTTDNRYQVLETILSRCQNLVFAPNLKEEQEISSKAEKFLTLLKQRKQEDLMLSYQELQEDIFTDKQESITILNELNLIFANLLKYQYQISQAEKIESIQEYTSSFTEDEIIKILALIEKKLQELQFNVHLKAWLDSFLLLLMEV